MEGSTTTPSLATLLQQSRKLVNHQGARSELPHIQLGLDQIENQSRRLVARSSAAPGGASTSTGAPDAKAHYFLASAGIDASQLAETIGASNIASAFEPLQPIHDTDVESYLRHSHEQIILSAIEEGRRETLGDFKRSLTRTMVGDWSRAKRRIYEELGQHRLVADESVDFSKSRAGSAPRQDASYAGGQSSITLHSRMMRYDPVITRLNSYRQQGTPFALAHALGDAIKTTAPGASETMSAVTAQLTESWKALARVVGEEDVVDGDFKGISIRERQFAPAHAHLVASGSTEIWRNAEARDLKKRILTGACGFLEQQFSDHIDSTIASNPVKAQLGGAPSTVSRVSAFLRVVHQDREGRWAPELELIRTSSGQQPVWATIYYLLRTGNASLALSYASEHHDVLHKLDGGSVGGGGGFVPYFKAWLDSPDRRLPKNLRDRFLAEFNTRFRGAVDFNAFDPYKLGLYKLIGRIDVAKKFPSAMTRSTENWLWLQLSLIREADGEDGAGESEFSRERYTLEDLGRKLVNYGEAHFDPKGNRPLHYFQILLLCGQFERAVAFLYSRPQHQVDAVHFAITLAYYGLLRVPENAKTSHIDYLTTQTTSEGTEVALLDFSKLLARYVRIFARSDARSALQYLYLIALNSDVPGVVGEEQKKRCHDLIRQLVVDTRQYFDLLGDVRGDGTKMPGLIEKNLRLIGLSNSKEYLSRIVSAAAAQSAADHRMRDAILLYNIAEEYDTVVDVLNRELAAVLFEPPAETRGGGAEGESDKLQPEASLAAANDTPQLARAIMESYKRQNHILRQISPSRRETCSILLKLKDAVSDFARGELEKCLAGVEAVDLVPLRGDGVSITRKAEAIRDLDEALARNLPQILLMAMQVLYQLHQGLKDSPFGDASRGLRLEELRSKARCLMMFAGLLRLRIESGVYAQLTRLDVYLH